MSSDICRCSDTNVYVGLNKKDGVEMAVKVMKQEAIKMAVQEVKTLQKLDHQNIVRYQVKCSLFNS